MEWGKAYKSEATVLPFRCFHVLGNFILGIINRVMIYSFSFFITHGVILGADYRPSHFPILEQWNCFSSVFHEERGDAVGSHHSTIAIPSKCIQTFLHSLQFDNNEIRKSRLILRHFSQYIL